jgi:hypothetical protein
MGLFGFRKRAKRLPANDPVVIQLRIPKVNAPEMTPDQLRQELFDAAASGDQEHLCSLCQAHEKSIFEQGMIWSKVPPEIRSNPTLMKWYANGLKAIARFCADRLGKPELMEQVRKFEASPRSAEGKRTGAAKDIEGSGK